MTPFELDLLCHFYCIPEKHKLASTDLFSRTTLNWVSGNVIEYVTKVDSYRVTELGKAWLDDILSTPVPKVSYIGKDGKDIYAAKVSDDFSDS